MPKALLRKVKNDLPLPAIVILAMLPIPRVVLHDLRIVSFDSPLYMFFAFVPFIVWAGVALLRTTKRPFADFMTLGLFFGVFLALTHQLLWAASWGADVPRLGGNVAGMLDPLTENIILRAAAVISSVATGLFVGFAFGILSLTAMKLRGAKKSRKS